MVSNKTAPTSEHEFAVARAAKVMENYTEISNIGIKPAKNTIIVAFDLSIDLPSKTKAAGITKTGVKSVEPILLGFPSEYPEQAPRVFLRSDFPENTPHFIPGSVDSLPSPCLVQEPMDEYHMSEGLPGVLNQLIIWMQKAAVNKLVDHDSGWEPTYRFASDYRVFLDAIALVKLADGQYGSHILEATYFETQGDTVSRYSNLVLHEGSYDFKARLEDMQNDEVLLKQGFNGSLAGVYWVPENISGEQETIRDHFPENIKDHEQLQVRVTEMGAGTKNCIFDLVHAVSRVLAKAKSRAWRSPGSTVPIPVFILVRRPFPIVGSESNIEILSYIIEYPLGCEPSDLLTGKKLANVRTARTFPTFSRNLLSRMDDYEETASISLIGAGSVGSKIATSLSRSGWDVKGICDTALMLPHNYARHAVQNHAHARASKARLLAEIVSKLGGDPACSARSIIDLVNECVLDKSIFCMEADYIVNSTASSRVRLALSRLPFDQQNGSLVDAGLFKQGKVARLFIEGPQKNPNYYDLEALFYQKATNTGLARRLGADGPDLVPVDIGLGCGSVTMKMADSRLSSMTALMTEELMEFHAQHGAMPDDRPALIAFWEKDDNSGNIALTKTQVDPFVIVPIEDSDWTMRISPNVINTIERERLKYPDVETGGVLVGRYNELTKTVTIVDSIDAPPDSTRSAHLFSLGTSGATERILEYFKSSGQTLMDMGTWHTHLANSPPSPRDRRTAEELMDENRAYPFVLLIHTPDNIHAIMADPIVKEKDAAS